MTLSALLRLPFKVQVLLVVFISVVALSIASTVIFGEYSSIQLGPVKIERQLP